jgi:uncharacterized membrane protein YgcG
VTRFVRAVLAATILLAIGAGAVLAQPPAGPPYPDPVFDQTVYDYANVLSPETEATATATIAAIEERVGAEVVVYTQYKPGSTDESTDSDALELFREWGIGRAGFDDGLVVMWNTTRQVCQSGATGNGRVRLYAAPGYQAAYLSNSERQAIFDDDMLPHLRACDEDAALLAALEKIDANATVDHKRTLEFARIVDAAVGLIGGPLAFLLLVGAAGWSWLRYGKDPVYLDDPSIHMPAPPPDLTAASGAVVWEGRATRRALTTAMLDLASRGELAFVPEAGFMGVGAKKAGIQITAPTQDPYVIRNRRRPLSAAEDYALDRIQGIARAEGETGYIDPDSIPKFGQYATKFDERIEKHVASKGWFTEPPAKSQRRWSGRATIVLVGGIIAIIVAFNLPSAGLTILGGALIAAAIIMFVLARHMPARTMAGAMIYAMLAAYRRTLEKTMAQARSMNQVVDEAKLDWIETPDQAVVWGTALGLNQQIEDVLERSAEDARAGVTTYNPWLPGWYGSTASSSGGGYQGVAPGLFAGSAIPDFGGMMSALGSIGNSPSSSGSGSGGFSGGSGGGGGGGAGGGY